MWDISNRKSGLAEPAGFRVRFTSLSHRFLLPLPLALALGFAVVGIDWGLPYNWHADEKVNLAASMIDRHTADPGFFVNPTLHVYLVWGVVQGAYAVYPGSVVPSDVRWHVLSTRPNAPNRAVTFLSYRLSRLLSVTFALATVWLLWKRGNAAFGPAAGLLAAACLAVTMGLANLAHFATPETTLFFLVLAALGSFEALALTPTLRRYVVAGALIGLSCSTKYTVWLLWLPFLAAHATAYSGSPPTARHWWWVLASMGAAVVAFAIATPYSILSGRRFVEDLWFNWTTGAPSGTLAGQHRSWGVYVLTLGNALGWPLFVAAVAGALYTVACAKRLGARAVAAARVHGVWIVTFWGFYGISPHYALRFIMPIVPSLLLLGAGGLVAASRLSARHRLAVAAAMAPVLLYSALYTAQADRVFLRDPRYAAGAWLKQHVRTEATVGFFTNESYLPYFDRPAYKIQFLDVMAQSGIVGEAFQNRIGHIIDDGPDILVDANFYFDRFIGAPGAYPERADFYRRLLAGAGAGSFRPVAHFSFHGPWWLDPRPELVAPDVYVFAKAGTPWD
jgi:hypothetical protein